jgi:hypothetical protein
MRRSVKTAIGTFATVIALAGAMGVAAAQTDTPQPSRNDPPPSAPNQSSKDTVPPGTDTSLPTRGGKQEPSSKIEGMDPTANILVNGVLTVPGALPDSETAPAKFSERTNAADQLPISAYALGHLSAEQRESLKAGLQRQLALSGEAPSPATAAVGAEIPTEVALHGVKPLPQEIVSRLPELSGVFFTVVQNKILLVNPRHHYVIAVLQ